MPGDADSEEDGSSLCRRVQRSRQTFHARGHGEGNTANCTLKFDKADVMLVQKYINVIDAYINLKSPAL